MREIFEKTFDKIYCINLDVRPDRWEFCQKQFEQYNILDLVERLPAFHFPDAPEAGCATSHMQCIKNAKKHNYKNVFIFEDDFQFLTKVWNGKQFIDSDPTVYINRALKQLENISWDVLMFSYNIRLHEDFINYKDISDNVFQSTMQLIAAGYAVNSSVYDFMLDNDPSYRICYDQLIANCMSYRFKVFNIRPMVIGQRENVYSDLRGEERHQKWVEKMLQKFPDKSLGSGGQSIQLDNIIMNDDELCRQWYQARK